MKLSRFAPLAALALIACGTQQDQTAEADDDRPGASPADPPTSPSFDCAQSDGEISDLICETPMVARMDNELQRVYSLAETGTYASEERLQELTTMQRGWIGGRDDCWKAADKLQCVTTSYAQRIHEIRQGFYDSRQEDEKGISTGPLAVACDGVDYFISATFINADPGVVFLQWLDRSLSLTQVPSGSGAKYEGVWDGQAATLFTKGDEAIFTPPGGTDMNCKIEEPG